MVVRILQLSYKNWLILAFLIGLFLQPKYYEIPEPVQQIRLLKVVEAVETLDIIADEEDLSMSCNCYQYAEHASGLDFPFMVGIQPNTRISIGSIAIFDYDGLKHLAVITELHETYFMVKEANYEKCKSGERKIQYNDRRLKGFWLPTDME